MSQYTEIVSGKLSESESYSAVETEALKHPWSSASVESHIQNEYGIYLAAYTDGVLSGIASMLCISGINCEICNIDVKTDFRRRGIGGKLLNSLISEALRNGNDEIFLEVASDNSAAIRMYEKFKFKPVGLRKNYYGNGQDAILMCLKLSDIKK